MRKPIKTSTFIIKAFLAWAALNFWISFVELMVSWYGDIPLDDSGLFIALNSVIFYYWICGIPLMILLLIILRFLERIINKVAVKYSKTKK